jgi:TPR repeat protein
MPDDDNQSAADYLYAEGKKYDWKQDKSPSAATLAFANFQQAAEMGHTGAVRALAHLTYEGRGGPQDRKKGLLLLWSAFRRGDHEALEELGDLLASYAEQVHEPQEAERTAGIAETIEALNTGLGRIESFMYELARGRGQ